jgi:hypothetical protein
MCCRAKKWDLSLSDPDSTIVWVRLLKKAKKRMKGRRRK